MYFRLLINILIAIKVYGENTVEEAINNEWTANIYTFDLTNPTSWRDLFEYYNAVDKQWKICMRCGDASLGTSMHLELTDAPGSIHPAVIPAEYLLNRLIVIDASVMTQMNAAIVLSLEVALQWFALKQDPQEPTLLLFKFGWKPNHEYNRRNCVCKVPGLSYELAEWIAANLSHVVGVATDAPTLESEETREFTTRTVTNVFSRNGIYMIENVNSKRFIPESGCLVLTMPLKLINSNVVPVRLTAYCPSDRKSDRDVIVLKKVRRNKRMFPAKRLYDVNLEEILE